MLFETVMNVNSPSNESKRNIDRSNKSWYDLRTLKKIKLNAKDKLNAIKSKLHA